MSIEKMLFYTNIFVTLFLYAIYRFCEDNKRTDKMLAQPQVFTILFTKYGFRIESVEVAWYL